MNRNKFYECLFLLSGLVIVTTYARLHSNGQINNTFLPNLEQRNSFKINLEKPSCSNAYINDHHKLLSGYEKAKIPEVKHYKEIITDGNFTALCWSEILKITEDKIIQNRTLSKEYSIILESPGDIHEQNLEDKQNVSPFEVTEGNTKKSKLLNFTTVSETERYVIREHKTVICGAGPVLIREYTSWPKLSKKRIEIRLSPMGATPLRLLEHNNLPNSDYDNTPTDSDLFNTFDTTETSNLLRMLNLENVTDTPDQDGNILGAIINPINRQSKVTKTTNYLPIHNISKPTLTKSIFGLAHTDPQFSSSSDDLETGTKLLRKELHFVKFNASEIEPFAYPFNMTGANFTLNSNINKNSSLFDLIFPNKTVLESMSLDKYDQKFFISFMLRLERIIINGTDQMQDSIIRWEEDIVHNIKANLTN